jgi:hypothetical protein
MVGNGTMVIWIGVEVPLQVGKYQVGLITNNAISDSYAVYYALTMRSIMALEN